MEAGRLNNKTLFDWDTSQKIKRILHQANIRVWVFHAAAKKLETPLQTHMDMQDHRTKTGVYKTQNPPAVVDPSTNNSTELLGFQLDSNNNLL